MTLRITVPIGKTTGIIPTVVSGVKFLLNRLGFYLPDSTIGMNGFTDTAFFTGIKLFQKSKGLPSTGEIKPYDKTHKYLDEELKSKNSQGGFYVWKTVEDQNVRASHSRYNNMVRSWSEDHKPGSDYNCRCWAEPLPQVFKNILFYEEFPAKDLVSGNPFVSLEEFRDIYKGKIETEMTKEISDKIIFKHPTDMVNPKTRFVQLRNGKEVDMVHFMVVGRLGIPMGYINEIQQYARGKDSGFNPQDLYSNRLGVQFFEKYAKKIKNQPHKIADFIYEFLGAQ
jgi:hypothetical protein